MKNQTLKLAVLTLTLGITPGSFAATADQTAASAASAQVNADYFTGIKFKAGEVGLTTEAKKNLDAVVGKARSDGKIQDVRVLAWSDSNFYGEKTKLSKADQNLAKRRAEEIRTYLKSAQSVDGIDIYNMAKPAGTLSQFFKTTEAKIKNELTSANNEASKALVMVTLDK